MDFLPTMIMMYVQDLSPYLPTMIPGLKQSLLDPVPEVRTASARALGTMVRGMGEKGFEELVPWLMQTLTTEQSSVDRSGAAQGMTSMIVVIGKLKGSVKEPNILIYFFFCPSLIVVLFPMFCLLVEGECHILVF